MGLSPENTLILSSYHFSLSIDALLSEPALMLRRVMDRVPFQWQTSAATQIRWGLRYINDTYGSPCAAWSHEQATGWY
jgi:hypothetical protein